MRVKVCGNTSVDQLKQLNEMGFDYVGLIFYERSPRYVLNKLNWEEVKNLELAIKKVGVFVNATEEEIIIQIKNFNLDAVQLHGDETPLFCKHISDQVNVIKAFRINNNEQNIDRLISPFEEFCDYYLFDTGGTGKYGGTGEKFNWELLNENKINKPFFLSGGISLNDVDKIKAFKHPFFYGIDINSKFETEPGIKDIVSVKQFVERLNYIK
jgi:phosphoribosylanthranilate isomerase